MPIALSNFVNPIGSVFPSYWPSTSNMCLAPNRYKLHEVYLASSLVTLITVTSMRAKDIVMAGCQLSWWRSCSKSSESVPLHRVTSIFLLA